MTPIPAQAQSTVFVPCVGANGGSAGLAQAIITVQGGVTGTDSGLIELDEGCTYSFTDPFTPGGTNALPTITGKIVIHGKKATISRDANASTTFRIAEVGENASLTLIGVTIRGGAAFIDGVTLVGGGIINRGTLSLKFSRITHNSAQSEGGGIFGDRRSLTLLYRSAVTDNSVGFSRPSATARGLTALRGEGEAASGGGILVLGTLKAIDSVFSGNSALTFGGAIRNDGVASLTDSTVTNNQARSSGGGVSNAGTMEIKKGKIIRNRATSSGGGFADSTTSQTRIIDSLITRNIAGERGGGIFSVRGDISLLRTSVIKNTPNECVAPTPIPGCRTVLFPPRPGNPPASR
ncbi:hypothetical protein [Nonomuraea jabiensis]|uniref:Putative outer membrane repeat protein n=1 Tax=Nonomuraea jabiensis TaxID=882448 RepID=A0A7W9GB27_9ACTN|nr:hypothetical protein [Nonomuraea jabiensis]MBB5780515.1 putative outer membrane repeat protein [Nonomuraea jabiensis]